MVSADEPTPDVDALVAELRARVEERRQAGDYPPGLEELSRHFQRVLSQRAVSQPTPDLHGPLQAAGRALPISASRIEAQSQLPGGKAIHQAVARLVGRQTAGIAQQVQAFAEPVQATLTALVEAVESLARELKVDVAAHLDAIYERQAAQERALAISSSGLGRLSRNPADGATSFEPWYSADRFDEEFRGSREEILSRYRDLAERLAESGPVFDLGCGRGELLELLSGLGVPASGVDLDFELTKEAIERGLPVEHGDGLSALEGFGDAALGALVLIQVVEHMSAQQTVDLVAIAYEKVRVGGQVLIETVNPQSLYVFAHSFYLDPTHLRPVHPAYLAFLFREAGFASVSIEWRSPPPVGDVLTPAPDGAEPTPGYDENVRRLNQLLFAPQDYLVVATALMGIHQVLVAASPGDAVSNAALGLRSLLRQVGPSEVFARYIDPRLEGDVKPLTDLQGESHAVLIYHASVGEPAVASFLMGRPERLVLMYHNITPASYFRTLDPDFAELLDLGRAELIMLRERVALALAVSSYNRDDLLSLGYENVEVCPLPMDPATIRATPSDPEMVDRLDREIKGPLVLFVGQLLPHKRPDLLLQAFHVLVTYLMPEARLALVGGGRSPLYRSALEAFIGELQLPAWITGWVSDGELAALYRKAAVFVTMSEHEGVCVPLVEAMAHGVPIVARGRAAIPETVGSASLLLPAADDPALAAEAMHEVLSNPAFSQALVQRGEDRVTELDPSRVHAMLLAQLTDVV